MQVKGKYNTIEVFAAEDAYIEQPCREQIQGIADDKRYQDFKIRIMPDCHSGKGCVIGTTMRGSSALAVNPYLVGVDIGCGVSVYELPVGCQRSLDRRGLLQLDNFLRQSIAGKTAILRHRKSQSMAANFAKILPELKLWQSLGRRNKDYVPAQLGTLGSGNHFIEIDRGTEDESLALIIHSGSRYLEQITANHYAECFERDPDNKEGWYQDYLHDLLITQEYAAENRALMASEILQELAAMPVSVVESVHNYVELRGSEQIIRKGAIAAYQDSLVVIPFNMQFGAVILRPHGNDEWNYSLPHGAGRVMSRTQAVKQLKLEDFKEAMAGIVSRSVGQGTLDEAPKAYKDPSTILKVIEPQVELVKTYKPIYSFKN